MRNSFSIVLAMLGLTGLCCLSAAYAQETDSLMYAGLDRHMDEYMAALERESVETKIAEADYMLSACNTDEVRNRVAVRLYAHYVDSPVMGDEAVAIYLTDKWFVTGRAAFASDIDLMNARIFAEFNRQSLLGCRAPSLEMENMAGEKVQILGLADDSSDYAGRSSALRVLYFYAPDCAKCRLESVFLRDYLQTTRRPLEVFLVNTKDNKEQWRAYVAECFSIDSTVTDISHYWDPNPDSDFQMKYGVVQTPRMFLIDKSGKILGRCLDTDALAQLVESYYEGEEDFRREISDLLYGLASERGAGSRRAEEYLIDSLITGSPDLWAEEDETVAYARIRKELLGRASVGSTLPGIKVRGDMWPAESSRKRKWNLRKLKCETYIMFYSEGCSQCRMEKAAAMDLATTDAARVLAVNMDAIYSSDKRTAELLLNTFDLTLLPYITLVDASGTVKEKYLSFIGEN